MPMCRITHPELKTVSECQEERSYEQNKKKAFERLVKKTLFVNWCRVESARRAGVFAKIEEDVDKIMAKESNLRVDVKKDEKWVEQK